MGDCVECKNDENKKQDGDQNKYSYNSFRPFATQSNTPSIGLWNFNYNSNLKEKEINSLSSRNKIPLSFLPDHEATLWGLTSPSF